VAFSSEQDVMIDWVEIAVLPQDTI